MISRRHQTGIQLVAFVCLFFGAVFFYSRHNDFPIYYHPDEELKGVQIVTGQLNYHHPLLLLDTGAILLRASGWPRTVENAVLCGRWASAIFTAFSLVALSALAWRRGGWMAGLLAAILIGLHPLFYELAHYCKEDPALLLGISLTLLMLDIFSEKPTFWPAIGFGAACGLAVSGKYLGAVMLLVAIPWVLWKGGLGVLRWKRLGAFLLGLIFVILAINLPFLLNLHGLFGAFGYELNAAQVGGAKGLTRDVPHAKYLGVFADNLGWALWIGLFLFVLGWFFRKTERRASDLVYLLMPLGYTLLLSFSPKTANRYFLAVSPLLILCGTLGFVWFCQKFVGRWRVAGIAAILLCAVLAIAQQWKLTVPVVRSFRTDSRMAMATWISENLPKSATIVAENRLCLTRPATWSQTRLRPDLQLSETIFAPDLGTLSELEKKGVRYVAVIRTSFGGYISAKRKPSKNLQDQHQRRNQFYAELFEEGQLLKKTGGVGVAHLNPEIRLYALPAATPESE